MPFKGAMNDVDKKSKRFVELVTQLDLTKHPKRTRDDIKKAEERRARVYENSMRQESAEGDAEEKPRGSTEIYKIVDLDKNAREDNAEVTPKKGKPWWYRYVHGTLPENIERVSAMISKDGLKK